MNKKILATILVSFYMIGNFFNLALCADSDVFQGHAEKIEQKQEQSELFTGQIETLDRKDVLRMTVSQVLDGSFSQEGDEFFAEVTNEVSGNGGVIIPSGTVAHGKIRQSTESKRLGRDGSLDLDFDYLKKRFTRFMQLHKNYILDVKQLSIHFVKTRKEYHGR